MSSCFLCSFKDFFASKFLVGWASPREACFFPLSFLVQFNSFNVPWETTDKWCFNSSWIFVLRKCFNLRAAVFKNVASLSSSHECFLKKLCSLFRQLLSFSPIGARISKLTMRTCRYSSPVLPSISQSGDATGNSTRIRGGIPKIYLRETWNMVCGGGRGHDDRSCSRSGLSPPMVTSRTLAFTQVPGVGAGGPPLPLVPLTHAAPAASSIPGGAAHTTARLSALPFP